MTNFIYEKQLMQQTRSIQVELKTNESKLD